MAQHTDYDVIVVGGGITGLSAAWYVQQAGLTYALLEAADHWGGKVVTRRVDHDAGAFLIDGGPDTFITRKSAAWDLAHALGLADEIVPLSNSMSGVYVLKNGEPRALPLSPGAFLTTSLMSVGGKLRMLAEPFIRPRRDHGDESLADFVTRRLGREALEQFIGPVLGGIYNANPDEQSIMVTNPFMRSLEREHGSLVRGMIARMRHKRARRKAGADLPPGSFTFKDGAGRLVEALAAHLSGDLRLNAPVQSVQRHDAHVTVRLVDGRTLSAAHVVLAVTANVAAGIVAGTAPDAAAKLRQIEHSSLGTITLLYEESALHGLDYGYGIMIPRREQRRIDAITWPSSRMPGRAPDGYVALRVFFGGGDPATADLPDTALLDAVRAEIADIIGLAAAPTDWYIYRWPNRYPTAAVGHLALVAEIEEALPAGLTVTGSSYRGLAVPDCIRQGKAAAETISDHITASPVFA